MLRLWRSCADFFLWMLRRAAWPWFDLAIRLSLAGVFFSSGVVKLANWQAALYLSANEYPVSWLDSVTAARVGVSIELLGAVCLALGLLTRYAAISLLALSLVIQTSYLPLDRHLFWIALFGWYAIIGASSLSFDALLRRGLADSALPLVPSIVRSTEWLRSHVGPIYLSLLRIWLGASLLIAGAGFASTDDRLRHWLPLGSVAWLSRSLSVATGTLLIAGLGVRQIAVLLWLVVSTVAMMDERNLNASYLLSVLVVLLIHGAGPVSFDGLLRRQALRLFPNLASPTGAALAGLPRIVILGAGFGGMACAVGLRSARAAVTLIDRANYHLFQPLLYQVATAALSPGDIAVPVRSLFRDASHVRVLLGTVSGIDRGRRAVLVGDIAVPFDYLVIATGAAHSYFGKDQWAAYAPGLKRIEDATEIRRRILLAFERAESAEDPLEREALLTFLVVGGGPTGVELAGAIAELARFGMDKDFRAFDPARARIILVQSGPRLLPTFPESLSVHARRSLQELGVEVLLSSRVEQIDATGVTVAGRSIPSRTVLWAAGVIASPAAAWLGSDADGAGRIRVGPDLAVPGWSNVFAIGDTASSNAWRGQPVPGLAPAAKQAGAYVARMIRARIEGRANPEPFVYHHRGSLATIGRKAAVADFGFIRISGAAAWWLWGALHVGFLVGLRNRLATVVNWFWTYLTYGGGIRLITGTDVPAGGRESS
jgi:NADH dehydrogenase/putative oxidoreductase